MNRSEHCSYYSRLGVRQSASPEEIKAAYRKRVLENHPDRIDREAQPGRWQEANRRIADLNAAYAVLSNPAKKRAYDQGNSWRTERKPRSSTAHKEDSRSSSSRPPINLDSIMPGRILFKHLPGAQRDALLNRQSDLPNNQARVSLFDPLEKMAWIAGAFGWFVFAFYLADSSHWGTIRYGIVGVGSLIAGAVLGTNVNILRRNFQSTLKPNLYATHLYFVKTLFDEVSYWPIWCLQDVQSTHHYSNDSYTHTNVKMTFEGGGWGSGTTVEEVRFGSKHDFERFVSVYEAARTMAKAAVAGNDSRHFEDLDEFAGVNGQTAEIPLSRASVVTFGSCFAGAAIAFGLSCFANVQWSRELWVDHSPERSIASSKPYKWVNPRPSYIPKPRPISRNVSLPSPVAFPRNGQVKRFSSKEAVAPFKIVTKGAGTNYMVKMSEAWSGKVVMNIFVHGGESTEVEMPLGSYKMKYVTGGTWYGDRYLFGDGSRYWKADTTFTFSETKEKVHGYTVELFVQPGGNMETEEIPAVDW